MKQKSFFISFVVFIFIIQVSLFSVANAATRIMPLGDSITQGTASGEPDEDRQVSYRKALWDKLVAARYDVDFVGSLNSGSAIFGALDPADHEGHPGWTDDEIVNGRLSDPDAGKLDQWLIDNQPDVVLLHIGTNGLDPSPDDVDDILDEIDNYSLDTWVVLALIVNRACCNEAPLCPTQCQDTTDFNDNVYNMASGRSGDKIIIVDMENDAEIVYLYEPTGDMFNDGVGGLHPFETGYAKMADVWFSALQEILPVADAGPNQSVNEGETVTLDGSNSKDPVNSDYFWEQTEGTPVTISDTTVVQPTFTAPDVGSQGQTLTFLLTVSSSNGLESTDATNVEVNGHSSSSDDTGCFIGTISE